ncbi:MAG: oligosaccharide flippase family protein [Lachnospiraceae bacterium]|jgi:O-antigen/teichoic acid export membrane protein|nr:oligosaccharide flippase family protein [Lachnospiraceae bacterium]
MSWLIQEYQQLSAPVKASFWFTLSNVLVKGVSFITLPIFSRILTPEEYGQVSVYSSWLSIFTIFCTLTIWGGVFNVAVVKYSEKMNNVVSAFQGMATTITVAFFIVTLIFIGPISNLLGMSKILTVCMYLDILAQTPFALWSSVQRYFYKYKALVILSIVLAVINPLIGFAAVTHTELRAEAKIITGLILNIILGVWLFVVNQRKGKSFFNFKYWKYGFVFNIVLIPHYLSLQVLSQSDRLMINNLCGSSDAGIYSVAYTFAMLLGLFTSAINSSFTPWIYKNIKAEDYTSISKISNVVVAVVATLSLSLICIIPDVFRWMLPEAYYSAVWVIPPVTVASYFMFLYPLFGAIEFYYEENRYITAASIIGAIINIGLNYIFIRLFGYIAAAYTTLFCYILFSLAHYCFMRKVLKKNNLKINLYDIKTLFFLSLSTIVLMVIITILYNSTLLRWSFIVLLILSGFVQRKKVLNVVNVLLIDKAN